jgi:hypothetical protein
MHETEVAMNALQAASNKVWEFSEDQKGEVMSKENATEVTGYLTYAYELLEKLMRKGVKTL